LTFREQNSNPHKFAPVQCNKWIRLESFNASGGKLLARIWYFTVCCRANWAVTISMKQYYTVTKASVIDKVIACKEPSW